VANAVNGGKKDERDGNRNYVPTLPTMTTNPYMLNAPTPVAAAGGWGVKRQKKAK
jgi:hypothetical protein